MGGSSKTQTVGYKYYLGMHMVLCHGPIDKITRIEVDDKVAWQGVNAGGSTSIDKESLFGGESKEGGVKGTLDIDMGGPTQLQNSYLVAQLGDPPAYRGVVGAILRQMYLGVNPYLKPWSFRGTRVEKTTDGAEMWYKEKSSITANGVAFNSTWKYKVEAPGSAADYSSPSYDDSSWLSGPGGFGNSGSGFSTPPVNTPLSYTSGMIVWIRKKVKRSALRGVVTVWADNIGALYVNGTQVALTAETIFKNTAQIPSSLLQKDNTIAVKVTDAGPAFFYAAVESEDHQDMNPAHIIRECLVDPVWGMGYPESDIDDASFAAAADTLFDEELGMSLLWDRQMVLEDFIKEVVRHIDAALYVSRTTGKFVLKLIRSDYDPDDLITLDESNIAKVSNPTKPTFGELSNSVTVKFWDFQTGNDASVTVMDTAMVQQQGVVIGTTVQYPGFTTRRNAILAAQRDLRSLSSSMFSCTIYCDQTASELNIGDTFKFSWARWQIQDKVMRVTGIAFGDGKANQVRVTCTEDIFSTPLTAIISDGDGGWVDPSQPPSGVLNQIAGEIPYYELTQNLGQTSIDNTLSANPDVGYVFAAAGRPSGAVNGRIWTDDGDGTYDDVGGFDFAPTAELDADIAHVTTVVSTINGSDLDQITTGTYGQLGEGPDCEIVRIDAVDTGTGALTIGRGCLDTTPKAWPAGTLLVFWDAYGGYDPTEYVAGETIGVKITAITGQGQLDVDDASETLVNLESRAIKPYPPGQFKINGSYYPAGPLEGMLTFTWVGRDRLQQTSGVIYDHTAANIGPEAGVTYRMRAYIDDVLFSTQEPVTSGMTFGPAVDGLLRIEIDAKRDGYYSWQPASHEFYYTGADFFTFQDGDYHETEDGDYRVTED